MACFLMSMAVAGFTTAFRRKFPAKYHINWLNMLLWGGVGGLALEHVASGEIILSPPFLTAMASSADTAVMLQELATIGTAMLVGCVAVWAVMVFVYNRYFAESGAGAAAQ